MPEIRFDGQVVVITGAGNGIGKQYAKLFASRGAKVVVNDLGGSINGDASEDSRIASQVVREIEADGGIAVPNFDSVEEGEKIVATAIEKFGRIDVLINNAGILRDITLRKMSRKDWDLILAVHLEGAYRTVRAAWPYFVQQGYGRILNTTSSSGLFGNFGQSNYAAAKTALLGWNQTLAQEGEQYNIHANILAPGAASRLTATVWPPEMMELMDPVWIAPLIAVLCHSSCNETGAIFEAAVGHFSKIRRIRTPGILLHPSKPMSPELIAQNLDEIQDLDGGNSGHAIEGIGRSIPTLAGKVALVVGAGTRMGRCIAYQLAERGVQLVIQDNISVAEQLARDLQDLGGHATPVDNSDGAGAINTALQKYGRIDIVINTEYVDQPTPFISHTDAEWSLGTRSRLNSAYEVIKEAWPYMQKQKFGRIVNVISPGGVDGKPGYGHYAAGESGLIGFSKSISREGAKYNIHVNVVATPAASSLRETSGSPQAALTGSPEYVAPLVTVLCSEQAPSLGGQLYEAGGGSFKLCRWQRTLGYDFSMDEPVPTPEAVGSAMDQICNFSTGKVDFPDTPADGSILFMQSAANSKKGKAFLGGNSTSRYLDKIKQTIGVKGRKSPLVYTDRDVLLYNLSVGAKHTDLSLVYEGDPNFQVLPTFGILPVYTTSPAYELAELVPNFDMRMLLHGEQYMRILKYPIPTQAKLVSQSHLVEVVDKGNAALVRTATTTVDAVTGEPVFYNEGTSFIRGAGGFGGPKKPSDRGAATAANTPLSRDPDHIVEEKTFLEQAAFYRLMGDRNPLHIDPSFSAVGGFKRPIIHGLATLGVTGRHIWSKYGAFQDIKVRFAGTVIPGETVVTKMWKQGNKVIFEAYIKETGKTCISNAAVELVSPVKSSL